MEDDDRPFQAVSIGMTSVETVMDRFADGDNATTGHRELWRCNVTALSQRYNLFFVASDENIEVYQPEFPFQKLKRKPDLLIPPTLANPWARGHIDPTRPHSVNHLIVGELGTEEIILAATDSGNVVAYHTKSIDGAIRKDPYKFSENARSDFVSVRAFFSQWVHESAWGLAIHREGRMIAVSANAPVLPIGGDPHGKITVFAFALAPPEDPSEASGDVAVADLEEEDDAEWHQWNALTSNGSTPTRDRNYKIVLAGEDGHEANIPSVAFVNTYEDPEGAWLISTDIDDVMKVWQTWSGICYDSWDFARSPSDHDPAQRERARGWLVAALDPLACRTTRSMDEFCGHSKAAHLTDEGEIYDITRVVELRIPGNSHVHPLMGQTSDEDDDFDDEEDAMDVWSEDDVEEAFTENVLVQAQRLIEPIPTSLHLQEQRTDVEDPGATNERGVTHLTDSHSPADQLLVAAHAPVPLTTLSISTEDSAAEDDSNNHEGSEDSFSDDEDSSGRPSQDGLDIETEDRSDSDEQHLPFSPVSDSIASSNSSILQRNTGEMEEERLFLNPPSNGSSAWTASRKKVPTEYARQLRQDQIKQELRKTNRVPFIPTLHCNNSHLRILNAPLAKSPHFYCANMLRQTLPPNIQGSRYREMHRLNMIQQIPELGIVIIATQIGRCAVCTLTKNGSSGLLGLRVDWTLPTKAQEKAGARPVQCLLGIAVAPIQGRSISQTHSSSDDSFLESWPTDGLLDGVNTTFDPHVLALNNRVSPPAKGKAEEQRSSKRRRTLEDTKALHKRRSLLSQHSRSSQASTEQRPWVRPESLEPWSAVESSRRYRLMLTYMNMTVLTYEISRGVEKDDVLETQASSWELTI